MHWNLDGGLYYPKTTPELIEELAENNCYRVFLPVENPDIELMHGYHKYKSLKTQKEQREKLEKVINNLNNAGIEFYSAIMIGFPNETWESVKNTVDYAEQIKDAGAIGVGFHWVHPYPFTPFYDKQYQLVRPNKKWENSPEHYTFIKPVFPIENISLEKAEEYVNERAHKINRTAINNNSCQYK